MTNDTQRADVDADALAARAGDAGGLQPLAEFALEAKGLAAGRAERDRRAGNNGAPPQYPSDEPAPSHNLVAEKAVLGEALYDPDAAPEVAGILAAGDFYDPRHRAVCTAMLAILGDGATVDPVTMWDALLRLGLADVAGGYPYIPELMASTTKAQSVAYHAGIVRRLAIERRGHEAAQRVATAARADDPGALARVLRDELATLEASDAGPAPLEGRELDEVDWEPAGDEWLIDNWLPIGTVTLMHGSGSAGKSALALQLACAIAGDGEHDRWPVGEHGLRVTGEAAHVVLATFEDSADFIQRRRRALIKRGYEPATRESLCGRVHVTDMSDEGELWTPGKYSSAADATVVNLDRLAEYAAGWAAKLIVIDPLYCSWGGNEIDRAHVGAFVKRLRVMADELQAAVLLVSHPAKGSAGGDHATAGEYPSGSSTWFDGPRAVWRLAREPMPGPDGKVNADDVKVLALTLTKSNNGTAHPAGKPGRPTRVYLESPDWPLYKAMSTYVKHVVPPPPPVPTAPEKPSANGAAGHGEGTYA